MIKTGFKCVDSCHNEVSWNLIYCSYNSKLSSMTLNLLFMTTLEYRILLTKLSTAAKVRLMVHKCSTTTTLIPSVCMNLGTRLVSINHRVWVSRYMQYAVN